MQEIDSTNNFLRRYQSSAPLTLVTAEYQTAGHGQAGNTWESATGANLLCSFKFTPADIQASDFFLVNQAVSLAVRDACQEFLHEDVTVKWPNDIYVGNRKLSGILIETEMSGSKITTAIAGIGINVNQAEWQFTSNAAHPVPVSLSMLAGQGILVRNVLEQLVGHIQKRISQLSGNRDAIACDYISHLYRREGMHRYIDADGSFMARIIGIAPTGELTLETDNGTRRSYMFKEITFC